MGESELPERVGDVDIAFIPASFGQTHTEVLTCLSEFYAFLQSWIVRLCAWATLYVAVSLCLCVLPICLF